jgi:hypothetical protein
VTFWAASPLPVAGGTASGVAAVDWTGSVDIDGADMFCSLVERRECNSPPAIHREQLPGGHIPGNFIKRPPTQQSTIQPAWHLRRKPSETPDP